MGPASQVEVEQSPLLICAAFHALQESSNFHVETEDGEDGLLSQHVPTHRDLYVFNILWYFPKCILP